MKFTDKLDALMLERGISRGELAKQAGIPYTTIVGFYDKGYENAKLSTLQKLVNYFGCSLDFLADDDIEKPVIKSDDGLRNEFENLYKLLTPQQQEAVKATMRAMQPEK